MHTITNNEFRLINWNIGGAKYLQLRSEKRIIENPVEDRVKQYPNVRNPTKEFSREAFSKELDNTLGRFIADHNTPPIITLQEVAQFEEKGDYKQPKYVFSIPTDYEIIPTILIDTRRHSHQGKWNIVRNQGEWDTSVISPFFGQGNAFLVHKNIKNYMFPMMALPKAGVTFSEWEGQANASIGELEREATAEEILLQQGLYFGNRDTEPRAASVCHFCVPIQNNDQGGSNAAQPLDIFIVNVHLTTLTHEREGIPSIDIKATNCRFSQLDVIFDGIISRYNKWRKSGYQVRGDVNLTSVETNKRRSPIWIITGDFNFTPKSAGYRRIIDNNFIDLIKDHDAFPGSKASGLGKRASLTLDYVFLGPLFESINQNRIKDTLVHNWIGKNQQASDHFPVGVSIPFDCLTNPK